jgi:hypothetical protein
MRYRSTSTARAVFCLFLLLPAHSVMLAAQATPAAATPAYVVVASSELGMHCMDGKDYSIFSVLPPYNTIHAQVLRKGEPPVAVTSGITVSYVAMADLSNSINTTSAGKTNFWSYVRTLFLSNPPVDIGLTGNKTQSLTPHLLKYNAPLGYWVADAIPTVPYDDKGVRNPYPMAKIVVKDTAGTVLATTTVVLAVSDEMRCSTCHASNSNPAAKPKTGWVNNADPAKDVKLNILKLHDDHVNAAPYLAALKAKGYTYQASLLATARAGTPILCATCHASNALSTAGVAPVKALTADMHTKHGPVLNPATGVSLDQAANPTASCYLCHPGVTTKCQRGAMNKIACFNCHGTPTQIGKATRAGWLDVPACQMCHTNSQRYLTTFSSPGVWRATTDKVFATNANVPVAGKQLFRYSKGHGNIYCSACHGAPHAEYPTLRANDNLYSTLLQGHSGKIAECSVCHTAVPVTLNGGPHGMHTIGQAWVGAHHNYVESGGPGKCAYCHGSNYKGTVLSATSAARTLTADDGMKVSFVAGAKVGCYDCHNGPNGG